MLGEPDLVVPFTDTIILPGDNDDHFSGKGALSQQISNDSYEP